MAWIPEDILERIRAAVPLEDLIAEYVQLKRSGSGLKGLCPFHSEKTPSFHVNPQRQIYKCFGCGEAGNIFTFLMKVEHLSFPEAVRKLALRAGITLPEEESDNPAERQRNEIHKINEKALQVWQFWLLNRPEAEHARAYLAERGFRGADGRLDTAFITQTGLGFAPDSWDALLRSLRQSGFSEELGIKAGLLRRSEQGRVYDTFRHRLMIPIRDVSRHVIGFGGRTLPRPAPKFGSGNTAVPAGGQPDEGPKYLNTPETPAFHKSEHLYGLDTARTAIREADEAIIVEGYFDVLMLHYKGLRNTVAPLGTALTRQHMAVLQRYSRNLLLVFDPDTAGEKATWRTVELLLEGRFKIRILRLPLHLDPCDYILSHGADAFRQLAAQAPDLFAYLLSTLKQTLDPSSVSGKLRILDTIFKYAAKLDNEVERELVLDLLSRDLGISMDALRVEFQKFLRQKTPPLPSSSPHLPHPPSTPPPHPTDRRTAFERDLALLLLIHSHETERLLSLLSPDEIHDPVSRRVVQYVLDSKAHGTEPTPHAFLSTSNDAEAVAVLTDLIVSGRFGHSANLADQRAETARLWDDYLKRLQTERLDQVIRLIKDRIPKASPEELPQLQADLAEAIRARQRLR